MRVCAGSSAAALLAIAAPAWAQRATENAVTSADDAFGTNVGLETTGIYSEYDTRGFSPLKAGNSRIDGIYFDPVALLSPRLRASTAIRVGFAAEDFPFQAPTGIVDNRLHPWPTEIGASISLTASPFWGHIISFDLRVPMVKDHIGLTGGYSMVDLRSSSGQRTRFHGIVVRPIFRYAGIELAPFMTMGTFTAQLPQPLVVVSDYVPALPPKRRYLGQEWAKGQSDNNNFGVNLKASITDRLSLRGGLFRSEALREINYSEIYTISATDHSKAGHRLISDPAQDVYSTSGEMQLAYRLANGRWQHRIIVGYRARDRHTDFGGSDSQSGDFGEVVFGTPDPRPEPLFSYTAVNVGRVRQSSFMIGYIGKLAGLGVINLGLQRAGYRADSTDGRTGLTAITREQAWLYNATVGLPVTDSISVYVGTQKGLEDSGAAPESAANRNEQLPATLATQYEGGVRWKFSGGQLAVNGFQITKPYFAFDAGRNYAELGRVRHRGVEASLSGHFGKRLSLLAGAVMMQPRVIGAAVGQGIVGDRPAGTPSLHARLDANYRTDIFGGLTPTASVVYIGSQAASSRPVVPGGKQLMLTGYATVDLGLRQQFRLGKVAASVRMVVQNVFDHAAWKVVAANTLQIDERRRMTLTLAADF